MAQAIEFEDNDVLFAHQTDSENVDAGKFGKGFCYQVNLMQKISK